VGVASYFWLKIENEMTKMVIIGGKNKRVAIRKRKLAFYFGGKLLTNNNNKK